MAAPVNPAMKGAGYRQPTAPTTQIGGPTANNPNAYGGIGASNPFAAYGGLMNNYITAQNQQYQNVLKGYPQMINMTLRGGQGVANQAYGMLGIGPDGKGGYGIAAPLAQQINNQYANQAGQNVQNAIGSGLGYAGSTVAQENQNQNNYYRNLSLGSLRANLMGQAAGYGFQANENAQNQVAGMRQGEMGMLAQLGVPPQPNLGDFTNIWGQGMQNNLAQQALMMQRLGMMNHQGGGYGGGGMGGGGYPPGGAGIVSPSNPLISGAAHGPLPGSNLTLGGGMGGGGMGGGGMSNWSPGTASSTPSNAGPTVNGPTGYGIDQYTGFSYTPENTPPWLINGVDGEG